MNATSVDEGFGDDEAELIRVAAALAQGLYTVLDESRAFPERRCALPSLIGPALEQIAVILSVAVGPVQISAADPREHDVVAVACRMYPDAKRVAQAICDSFKACMARELPWPDMQRTIRESLGELAVSQATATARAPVLATGGDA